MSKCPKCNSEIAHLHSWSKVEQKYEFNGNNYHETDDALVSTGEPDDYECPECSEVLFSNEEEAKKFLGEANSAREDPYR